MHIPLGISVSHIHTHACTYMYVCTCAATTLVVCMHVAFTLKELYVCKPIALSHNNDVLYDSHRLCSLHPNNTLMRTSLSTCNITPNNPPPPSVETLALRLVHMQCDAAWANQVLHRVRPFRNTGHQFLASKLAKFPMQHMKGPVSERSFLMPT